MRGITAVLLTLTILLTGCSNPWIVGIGNHIYIYEGYKEHLSRLGLQEIRSFPNFTKPFIVVGQNDKGEQFAVLFEPSGVTNVIQLALPVDKIIEKMAAHESKTNSTVSNGNIHLFYINDRMIWSYSPAERSFYMSDKGEILQDPWTREHEHLITKENDKDFVNFYLNATSNRTDWVHVVQYTSEGNPVNHIIASKGNGFEYTFDSNSQYVRGAPGQMTTTCEGIDRKEFNDRSEYTLRKCSDPIGDKFIFTVKKP